MQWRIQETWHQWTYSKHGIHTLNPWRGVSLTRLSFIGRAMKGYGLSGSVLTEWCVLNERKMGRQLAANPDRIQGGRRSLQNVWLISRSEGDSGTLEIMGGATPCHWVSLQLQRIHQSGHVCIPAKSAAPVQAPVVCRPLLTLRDRGSSKTSTCITLLDGYVGWLRILFK